MSVFNSSRHWMTIRIGRGTLSFAVPSDDDETIVFEPYVVKSGISMAANLREAFKHADLLLEHPRRARVMVDADALMVPVEMFQEQTIDDMYRHAFPSHEQDQVFYNVLPDLNAVVALSMNKDLRRFKLSKHLLESGFEQLFFASGLETDLGLFIKYSVSGGIIGIGGVVFSFVLGDK